MFLFVVEVSTLACVCVCVYEECVCNYWLNEVLFLVVHWSRVFVVSVEFEFHQTGTHICLIMCTSLQSSALLVGRAGPFFSSLLWAYANRATQLHTHACLYTVVAVKFV